METTKTITTLEIARLEIEGLQKAAGSAAAYLDRGRPGPGEKAKAQAFIRETESKTQSLKTAFKANLQNHRANRPEILDAWVQAHLDTLAEIIAETEADKEAQKNNRTRLYVAKKTVTEWQEVLAGKRNYVSINHYFMKDYNERLLKTLPELDLKKIDEKSDLPKNSR